MKILVVEDELLIALEIEMIIGDLGHDVVGIADTCAEALKLAAEHKPDAATVDLRLRGGDRGEDLARELRDRLGIRSIFISGNLDKPTRILLEPLQPYGCIGKPLSPASLAEALTAAEGSKSLGGTTSA